MCAASLLLLAALAAPAAGQTVFRYGFELGWNGWWTDNGEWGIGVPTPPPNPYSGVNVAGTNLAGNHDGNNDSRLISPDIFLPTTSGSEEIWLTFQQWFSYSACDAGYVQIATYDAGAGTWSTFATVGQHIINTSPWSLKRVDLTDYAGEQVRVAFYHTANSTSFGCGGTSLGWYIDDVEIVRAVPAFTGGFEPGEAGWSADRGVWQIGAPTSGPAGAFMGMGVAGTVLAGNHPGSTDSRLVSPTILLDSVGGAEELHLRFQEWFSYSACDVGYVQISTYDSMSGLWSAWVTLGQSIVNTSPWSLKDVDLTDYAGELARLAFYHTANSTSFGCGGTSLGWYIDDVEIVRAVPAFTGCFEPGEAGWSADRGVWQIGAPTSGPAGAFTGMGVAGTVLDGNHPGSTDSRLVSPTLLLDSVVGAEELHLRFQQWLSYSACDVGFVQISTFDLGLGKWTDWLTVGSPTAVAGTWSLEQVDLTAHAGQLARLAFYHTADSTSFGCGGTSTGWYIDDVRVQHTLGTIYCSPAVANSTGFPAEIRAMGSSGATDNLLDLLAIGMPANKSGYFLASMTQGFIPHPGGSMGNLCITGKISRFAKQIQSSGAAGRISVQIDLTNIPPNPPHTVVAGETWNFTTWYRDNMNASNFTDAVSITFQ